MIFDNIPIKIYALTHFISTCRSPSSVVANKYTSPPSFSFHFFRSSATEAGKLRTVRLALSTPCNNCFSSFFPKPDTSSTRKRRPGNQLMYRKYKDDCLHVIS